MGSHQDPAKKNITPSASEFRDIWGKEAHAYLASITGTGSTAKRRTLMALMACTYSGGSIARTLNKLRADGHKVGSRASHYRWLEEDKAYATAYQALIGDEDKHGLTRQLYQEELAEDQAYTLALLQRQKLRLAQLAPDSIDAIEHVLKKRETGQKVSDYALLQAAGMVLDRLPETQQQMQVNGLTAETLHHALTDGRQTAKTWQPDKEAP